MIYNILYHDSFPSGGNPMKKSLSLLLVLLLAVTLSPARQQETKAIKMALGISLDYPANSRFTAG